MDSRDRDAVFLTGATGFLGRELLWKLMTELPPEVDIVCLIRGELPREARAAREPGAAPQSPDEIARLRLAELFAEGAPCGESDPRRQRVHAVAGDITQPRLGLSEDAHAALAGRCRDIYHGAATVRFDLPLPEARRVNVEGTRAVLRLALAAQEAGKLRRLAYIGTAFVAGNRRGRVLEDELVCGQSFNNTYEQTKAAAEALVREHMDGTQGRLPVTIFRPSIIVGDSKSGYTSSFKVMYWPLKIFSRGLLPIVPGSYDGRVDLIPVDYVVDAIWALTSQPGTAGRCYHLCAGPEHATTIGAAMEQAARFFRIYKPLLLPTERYEKWVRPVLNLVLRGKRRKALDTGRVYVPYLSYAASFDTQNARRDLRGLGLPIPDVSTYFETLMRYCVDSDWGRKAVPVAGKTGASPATAGGRPEASPP